MTLKTAFIVSLAIHSALFLGSPNIETPHAPEKKEKTIEVDYVTIKEDKPVKTAEVKTAEAINIETPKVELKKDIEPKPSASISKTPIKSTEDYINYYQLIREKIRRRLKDNYIGYSKEGEVYLTFTLN